MKGRGTLTLGEAPAGAVRLDVALDDGSQWRFKGELAAGTAGVGSFEVRGHVNEGRLGGPANFEMTVASEGKTVVLEITFGDSQRDAVFVGRAPTGAELGEHEGSGRWAESPSYDYMVEQLPAPMASDPGIVRFLRVFEEISGPLYERSGQHHLLMSPATAPPRMIEWLSSIRGLGQQEGLSLDRQRVIAQTSNEVFRHRGSTEALRRLLEAYTGDAVRLVEPGGITTETDDVERLEAGSAPLRRPAIDADLAAGSGSTSPQRGVVLVELETLGGLTPHRITSLVRQLVPAHLIPHITVAGVPLTTTGESEARQQKAS